MTVSALFEVDVVVDAHASGGAYALLDVRAGAGAAVPRHVGRAEEAVVHVLAGAVAVRVGREARELRAGDHVVLPRDVPRSAEVLETSRILLLFVPAGAERLALLADDGDVEPDDVAALLAAAGFSRLP